MLLSEKVWEEQFWGVGMEKVNYFRDVFETV